MTFTFTPFLAVTFDMTIGVGNILGAVAIAAMLFVTRKLYDAINGFVDRVGATEEVVDEHTDVMRKAGWFKESPTPYVGERRRKLRRAMDDR